MVRYDLFLYARIGIFCFLAHICIINCVGFAGTTFDLSGVNPDQLLCSSSDLLPHCSTSQLHSQQQQQQQQHQQELEPYQDQQQQLHHSPVILSQEDFLASTTNHQHESSGPSSDHHQQLISSLSCANPIPMVSSTTSSGNNNTSNNNGNGNVDVLTEFQQLSLPTLDPFNNILGDSK